MNADVRSSCRDAAGVREGEGIYHHMAHWIRNHLPSHSVGHTNQSGGEGMITIASNQSLISKVELILI